MAAPEFCTAVREWVVERKFKELPSANDALLVISYCPVEHQAFMSEEEIQLIQFEFSKHVHQLAGVNDVEVDITYDSQSGKDLNACIVITSVLNRIEAQGKYYDLLQLGPRLTPEQFIEMGDLRKKYGFV